MPERIGLVAELDLTQFDRAVGSYIRSVNRMERATSNVADSMIVAYARLGGVIATSVGAAVTAVGALTAISARASFEWLAEGVEDAANFEQQMAEIGAVLVKTRAEVEPLAALINKIALDPKLVVSAEEAGAMVEQLARNGVEMKDILDGAARASILLANATGGDFAMAADVATMAMHMFNMEAKDLNRIADVSQQVINNTRIELDDWKLALGNGGAVAAAYGITIEEFAATIESTVNSFHSARQAGTSMMNFVQRLVPITKVAADEMKKLGLYTGLSDEEFSKISKEIEETELRIANLDPRLVHYDELVQAHRKHAEELRGELVLGKNAFFDESGAMKDLGEVANVLIAATKDLSMEEKAESFRRIFGNDAMETAIKLSQMGIGELQGLAEAYKATGSAEAAAATRTDTLAKKWENLQDIWDSIRRLSGEKFIGMLTNLVAKLTILTDQNKDRVIEFFGRMAELLNHLVDAGMPFVERLLPKLLDNISALAHWLVELVLGGDGAQEWFAKLHPTIQKTILRVFEMVRIGKEFIRWLVDTAKAVREALRPFTDWVQENVTLRDSFIAIAGAVAAFLAPLALLMTRMAIAGFGAAKAISLIRRAWQQDLGHIRTIFYNVWPKIQKPLIDFVNNFLLGQWGKAWDNAVYVVLTALDEIYRYAPRRLKPFLDFISSMLQGQWGRAWDSAIDIVRVTFELIKIGLARLRHPFTDFILRILEGKWMEAWRIFQKTAVNVLTFLRDRLPIFFKPFADLIISVLRGDWTSAWEHVKKIAINAYHALVQGLRSVALPFTQFIANVLEGKWRAAWKQIQNFTVGVLEWLKANLPPILSSLFDTLIAIVQGRWLAAWNHARDFIVDVATWLRDNLPEFFKPLFNAIIALVRGRWLEAFNYARDFIVNIAVWLRDHLPTFFTPLFNAIIALVQGRWLDAFNHAREFIVNVFRLLQKILPSILTNLFETLIALVEGRWLDAWNAARRFIVDIATWLRDHLPAFFRPLFDAIIALVEGRWLDAFNHAREFIVNIFRLLQSILPSIFSNLFEALIALVEGRWLDAFNAARRFIVDIATWLRDHLPAFFVPLFDAIIALVEGRWLDAFNEARKFIVNVFRLLQRILPSILFNLFETLIALVEGRWLDAWNSARLFIVDIATWLRDNLPAFFTPLFEAIIALVEGRWLAAFLHARDFIVNIFELLRDNLPAIFTPMFEALIALLEGRWKDAWDQSRLFIVGVAEFLRDHLPTLFTPLFEAIIAVMEGRWTDAWNHTRDFIIGVLQEIQKFFGEGFISDVLQIMVDFVEGDWRNMWTMIQSVATDALTFIRDRFLPDYLDPIANMLIAMINGNWKLAWEEAKNFVVIVRDFIVEWLAGFDNDFASLATNILTGNWALAWENAKSIVLAARDIIVDWLTNYDNPFSTLAQGLLTGNWKLAWDGAVGITQLARDEIVKILADFETPFADLGIAILTGNWAEAWKNAMLIARAVRDDIALWLVELETPFALFIANVLVGNWAEAWTMVQVATIQVFTNIAEALGADLSSPILLFLTAIVLGEWTSAWMLAEEAFNTALQSMIDIFNELWEDIGLASADTRFPDWLRSIFGAMYAIHEATMAAVNAFAEFYQGGEASFGTGNTDTWQENVTELGNSIRQLANYAQIAFLAMHNFIIATNAMSMPATFLANADQFAANLARIKELQGSLSEEGAMFEINPDMFGPDYKGSTPQNPLGLPQVFRPTTNPDLETNPVPEWMTNQDGQTSLRMQTADVISNMSKIRGELEPQYLQLEDIARLSGQGSVEAFGRAFMSPTANNTSSNVKSFADGISLMAAAIKDGFYESGSLSVSMYVKALGDQYGIAQDGAKSLADSIIGSYGSRLTEVGGQVIPSTISKVITDPITGQIGPVTDATYNLSELAVKYLGMGFDENGMLYQLPVENVVNKSGEILGLLPDIAAKAGGDSTFGMGGSVTATAAQATDPFSAIKQKITEHVNGIAARTSEVGAESMTGMGTTATENSSAAQNPFQELQNFVFKRSEETVATQTQAGTDAMTGMGTSAAASKGTAVTPFDELVASLLEDANANVETTTQAGEDSMTGMGKTASENAHWAYDPFAQMWIEVADSTTGVVDDATQAGTDSMTGMGKEADANKPKVTTVYDAMLEYLTEETDAYVEFMNEAGGNSIIRFSLGMLEKKDILAAAYENIMTNVHLPAMQKLLEWMQESGEAADVNFALGIENGKSKIETAGTNMGTAFKTKVNEQIEIVINNFVNMADNITALVDFNKFNVIGEQIGNGIKAGIDSTKAAVEASATGLINQAETGIVNEAQIASPSKVFEYLGSMSGEGLLQGWEHQIMMLEDMLVSHIGRSRDMLQVYAYSMRDMYAQMQEMSQANTQMMQKTLEDSLQYAQRAQEAAAIQSSGYQRGSMGNNYATTNSSAVQFGPVYVNNEMDGAELIYRVQQVMDRRPL